MPGRDGNRWRSRDRDEHPDGDARERHIVAPSQLRGGPGVRRVTGPYTRYVHPATPSNKRRDGKTRAVERT